MIPLACPTRPPSSLDPPATPPLLPTVRLPASAPNPQLLRHLLLRLPPLRLLAPVVHLQPLATPRPLAIPPPAPPRQTHRPEGEKPLTHWLETEALLGQSISIHRAPWCSIWNKRNTWPAKGPWCFSFLRKCGQPCASPLFPVSLPFQRPLRILPRQDPPLRQPPPQLFLGLCRHA